MTPDPSLAAGALFRQISALLLEVRQVRAAHKIAVPPAAGQGEAAVYLAMLVAFERGLFATLEGVLSELEAVAGTEQTAKAEAWLRRQMEWLGGAR